MATALAVALAYFPYRLLDGSGAQRANHLRAQYERTRAASAALAEENARLRREISALESDSSALLDIARSELGMVFPDELIIRIETPPGNTSGNTPGDAPVAAPVDTHIGNPIDRRGQP